MKSLSTQCNILLFPTVFGSDLFSPWAYLFPAVPNRKLLTYRALSNDACHISGGALGQMGHSCTKLLLFRYKGSDCNNKYCKNKLISRFGDHPTGVFRHSFKTHHSCTRFAYLCVKNRLN